MSLLFGIVVIKGAAKKEIDFIYILSQIFTIIMYALLAWTYFLKDKRKIVVVSGVSIIVNAIAGYVAEVKSIKGGKIESRKQEKNDAK